MCFTPTTSSQFDSSVGFDHGELWVTKGGRTSKLRQSFTPCSFLIALFRPLLEDLSVECHEMSLTLPLASPRLRRL